jgi:hypothetical protein
MINKFFKTIHNKYSRFFRFIFFLRHLFGVFFVAIALFLIIPNFFDYEKRGELIKIYLIKNYDYQIEKYDKIEFKALPIPRLEIKNAQINLDSSNIKLNVKNLKIYPKIFNIYNYENFQSNKIELEDSYIALETSDFKFLIKNLFNQNNKLLLDNLDMEINDKNNSVISLENIAFSNFGYNKNLFKGEVFDKKFKMKISNNLKNINFKLLNSGISADIDLDHGIKDNLISGVFKSKILNTNLKFNFSYDNKALNIYNSYFRSKNLSFNNSSVVNINPFLDFKSKFEIENINAEIFKKLNLNKLLESKDLLKKINSKNEVNYIAKKFSRNLIDELNLKIDLAYGRVNYLKSISISDNLFQCEGNINFLEEFPLLFFNCYVTSDNKQDLLKKFSIKSKDQNKIFKLNVKGNLSILNKKINLKNISMNENYKASKEDLKYFKETFENIVFYKSFVEIFNFKKIKEFILEIS